MKKIPKDIQLLIKGGGDQKRVLYENNLFIVVVDPANIDNAFYHYTAWCKKDLRSLLDVEARHIPSILQVVSEFDKMKHQNSNTYVHFPPAFWRLHIHFVPPSHMKVANKYRLANQIHHIDDVVRNITGDDDWYRKRALIE
jgi:hypothetical protein